MKPRPAGPSPKEEAIGILRECLVNGGAGRLYAWFIREKNTIKRVAQELEKEDGLK